MEQELRIRQFISQNVLFSEDGYPYDDGTSFLDTGILDSTAVMDLVSWIHTEFDIGIDISEITAENFDSVRRVADFVRSKLAIAEPVLQQDATAV